MDWNVYIDLIVWGVFCGYIGHLLGKDKFLYFCLGSLKFIGLFITVIHALYVDDGDKNV